MTVKSFEELKALPNFYWDDEERVLYSVDRKVWPNKSTGPIFVSAMVKYCKETFNDFRLLSNDDLFFGKDPAKSRGYSYVLENTETGIGDSKYYFHKDWLYSIEEKLEMLDDEV